MNIGETFGALLIVAGFIALVITIRYDQDMEE
jgi:hypothetical protein